MMMVPNLGPVTAGANVSPIVKFAPGGGVPLASVCLCRVDALGEDVPYAHGGIASIGESGGIGLTGGSEGLGCEVEYIQCECGRGGSADGHRRIGRLLLRASLCKRRMQTTHTDHAFTACSSARSIRRKRYHVSLRSFRSTARLPFRRGTDAPLSNFTNMLPLEGR